MKYIAQVACGKKKLIKITDIKTSNPPKKIPELSLKRVWPLIKDNQILKKYLPEIKEGSFPPRKYLF